MNPAHDLAEIILRPAAGTDLSYVFGNWLDSYSDSWFSGALPQDVKRKAYQEAIERLLSRPGVRILVADTQQGGKPLAGFLAWEAPGQHSHRIGRDGKPEICGAPVLLYVYVGAIYRRARIASRLLAEAGINPRAPFCVAFKTAMLAKLIDKRGWAAVLDPLTYAAKSKEIHVPC